jgi:hypothetical protein
MDFHWQQDPRSKPDHNKGHKIASLYPRQWVQDYEEKSEDTAWQAE